MSIELVTRPGPHHLTLCGSEPVNFHSHHYNVTLQQSIEDAGACVSADQLLKDGGAIFPYAQLAPAFQGHAPPECLAFGAEHFRRHGFGRLDLSGVTERGGKVRLTNSHYTLGFRGRRAYSERRAPADHFACGYVEAVVAAAFGAPVGTYEVTELESALATGNFHSVLGVRRVERPRSLVSSVGIGEVRKELEPRPFSKSNIDEAAILTALSKLSFEGNDEGLIPAFGVYLSLHYGNYYCYTSFEFLRRLTAKYPELAGAGEACLVAAGHICAFNTFGGIMKSPQWNAVVGPMIHERRDWVFGITSCLNALGWGRWTVCDVDDKRLTMRIDAPYEANYYTAAYGKSSVPRCYFAQGAVAGIMDLFYTGDITQGPTLDFEYYDRLFSGPTAFAAKQTACPSMGDAYAEIVAERRTFD